MWVLSDANQGSLRHLHGVHKVPRSKLEGVQVVIFCDTVHILALLGDRRRATSDTQQATACV